MVLDSALLAGYRWKNLGPDRGGRSIAVSQTNPDLVFIGAGETCLRGNIMPGDGVYRSTDAGATWTHVGFGESHAIFKIRVHPTHPDVVFVASFGKYGAPREEHGVFKSTDGGLTGQALLEEIMNQKYIALFLNIESWNDYKRNLPSGARRAHACWFAGASSVRRG